MKKLNLLAVAVIGLAMTACSTTPRQDTKKYTVVGMVISSIKTPEVCKEKTSSGGTLLGGVLGGVIGNQFGKGKGKTAMTVVGAIAGASIGKSASDKNKGIYECKSKTWDTTVAFINPVTQQVDYKMMITDRRKNNGTRMEVSYVVPII